MRRCGLFSARLVEWREQLAQSPVLRGENLDELESHLRDAVVELQKRELTAEESFLIAARRIGSHEKLETEYARVNRKSVWFDRAFWMLIGIQVWNLTSGLIDSIARNGFAYGWTTTGNRGGSSLAFLLFALVQVFAFATSILFCWWLVVRKGEKISARVAPWLQRRFGFLACWIALCTLALLTSVFSEMLPALTFWSLGPATVQKAVMYGSYSRLLVTPLQLFAMIPATLLLARKRLKPVSN